MTLEGYTFSIPTLPGRTYRSANDIRKSLTPRMTWWQFIIFALQVVETCWASDQQGALRAVAKDVYQEYPHRSHGSK